MRILILDEEFPYPTNTGKRTRSYNLYRRLAKQFELRYVAFGSPDSEAAKALRSCGIEPIAVRGGIAAKQGALFYARLAANLLSSLPYIVTSHRSGAYREKVAEAIGTFRPDLVLCEWTPYTIYAANLGNVRKLVSTHNIEADIWQRYHETERNPLRRWYIGEQWRKVERFERKAMQWMDGALAVSALDRNRLLEMRPGMPVDLVPNGVDLDYFRPLGQPAGRHNLAFTGSMDWRPNQDAARYFAAEILPRLQREDPDIECAFIGRSPPPDIEALGSIRGMRITGTVDDVRPYVERAAVYVVPLRIGGGSRLKILEAMAMGKAVVSTTVGAEGLDVTHDEHLVLADDPEEFSKRVTELLKDPARCQQLAANGRRLVEQSYGWDALADGLARFIRKITTEGHAPRPPDAAGNMM